MTSYDVTIIGAGAAGLMGAIECGRRGRSVLVLEKSTKVAEKIRISGGGRCNFTNRHTTPANYISNNPRFCISALKRFTPADFIKRVEEHKISYHEKKLGQLFCDGPATQITDMLLDDCRATGVEIKTNVNIQNVSKQTTFDVQTDAGVIRSSALIVATGGKSIPKMGATSFGYDLAKSFGLNLIEPEAALVPLTFDGEKADRMKALSGVSLDARVRVGKTEFDEALLFTHRGLSGPSILQISSYWRLGQPITIDLLPGFDLAEQALTAKGAAPKQRIGQFLSTLLPNRLAEAICEELGMNQQLANTQDKALRKLAARVHQWQVTPSGTEGFRTAEVTRGGVDTTELSSQSFEAKKVPGLYFIGEVLDVTGHLGGFNFQWAWASGYAAGQVA